MDVKKSIKEKIISKLLEDDDLLKQQIYARLTRQFEYKKGQKSPSNTNWAFDAIRYTISTETFFQKIRGSGWKPLAEQTKDMKMVLLEEIFFYVGSIEAWCENNCTGEWGIVSGDIEYHFLFQDETDALGFKLAWLD